MNIFRIFFVSTVLIPVLVVVATSDDSGLRIRKPREVFITEDGTRTGRRHSPVNIADRNCPSVGCSGNLTTNSYNGKGSLASSMLPGSGTSGDQRSDNSAAFLHHHPLKLEIRSIKNSTRTDNLDYVVASDEETSRSFISGAIVLSWVIFWAFRALCSLFFFRGVSYFWNSMSKRYGLGQDYIETYVKVGQDEKHPFASYGEGWNPTFGISLRTPNKDGWKQPYYHQSHHGHYPSSYHHAWPPAHYGGWQYYGHHHKHKTSSEEFEDTIRHQFDKEKGWKYAKKYSKKYGKYAHKYGLRPSKYSALFDSEGNIITGPKKGHGWRRANLEKVVADIDKVVAKLE